MKKAKIKLVAAKAKATSEVKLPTGVVKTTDLTPEHLKDVLYEQPTCNVGMKMGYTKNLGNYESLRIDVSFNMPCYPQEVDTVFDYVKEWVDDTMQKIVKEAEEK